MSAQRNTFGQSAGFEKNLVPRIRWQVEMFGSTITPTQMIVGYLKSTLCYSMFQSVMWVVIRSLHSLFTAIRPNLDCTLLSNSDHQHPLNLTKSPIVV